MWNEPWFTGVYEDDGRHRSLLRPAEGLGDARVKLSDDRFQVTIDVRQFSPEDVVVQSDDKGELVVKGHHGADREGLVGGMFTERSFTRRFSLPDNCKEKELHCEIGTDGFLRVTVPRSNEEGAKIHHIRHEGLVHPLQKGIGIKCQPWHGWPFAWKLGPSDEDDIKVTGVNRTNENYVYKLKVPEFSPDEISIKTVDDFLVLEGSHEDKEDGHYGHVSRKFKRRYPLPLNANTEDLVCEIDRLGTLTVTVPPLKFEKAGDERIYKIAHNLTNP